MAEFGHKVGLFNETLSVVVQWHDRPLLWVRWP